MTALSLGSITVLVNHWLALLRKAPTLPATCVCGVMQTTVYHFLPVTQADRFLLLFIHHKEDFLSQLSLNHKACLSQKLHPSGKVGEPHRRSASPGYPMFTVFVLKVVIPFIHTQCPSNEKWFFFFLCHWLTFLFHRNSGGRRTQLPLPVSHSRWVTLLVPLYQGHTLGSHNCFLMDLLYQRATWRQQMEHVGVMRWDKMGLFLAVHLVPAFCLWHKADKQIMYEALELCEESLQYSKIQFGGEHSSCNAAGCSSLSSSPKHSFSQVKYQNTPQKPSRADATQRSGEQTRGLVSAWYLVFSLARVGLFIVLSPVVQSLFNWSSCPRASPSPPFRALRVGSVSTGHC